MNFVRALAALWELTDRRQRALTLGLVVLMIASSAVEMGGMLVLFSYLAGLAASPAGGNEGALRHMFDWAFGPHTTLEFALYGGLFVVGTFIFKNLFAIGVDFLNIRFLMKLYERSAPRLYEAYLREPYQRILLRGAAEPNRILSQMLELFNASIGSAMQVVSDLVLIVVIGALLLYVAPVLTIIAAVAFGTALAAIHYANRDVLARIGNEAVTMQRESSRIVSESFGGLISIRLSGTTAFFVEAYRGLIHRAALLNRRRRALAQLPRMSNEILLAAGIVAAVLYFGLRGRGFEAAVPTLALFGLAGLRLTTALSRLSSSLQLIRERQGELDALMATFREMTPAIVHPAVPAHPGEEHTVRDMPLASSAPWRFSGELQVLNVSFTYPAAPRPALERITLTIVPGSLTGFCGASGSGKSTLLLVMMGLIQPDCGDIRCDGWSIFDHMTAWHSRIGYVGQRAFISARSVRENVAFGRRREEIDDDRVWEALRLAQLADVIRQLPRQLDSIVGEDGSLISGGQRQRLDIARALYDAPEVLFLDEATAALDSVTERKVMEAIKDLSGSTTIICVAHRLSTIRSADVIHMMENGSIVASDTYEGLIAGHAKFREIARIADLR